MKKQYVNVETTDGDGKIKRVMHEWKTGDLYSSSGKKVTSQKQAVAIALSEQRRANKRRRG